MTAVRLTGGSPVVRNCIFRGNGIGQIFESPLVICGVKTEAVVEDCYFLNNSAKEGGALTVENSPQSRISACEFKENAAERGGAIYVEGRMPTIVGNKFWNNNATQGSAIFLDGYRGAADVTKPVACQGYETDILAANEVD